MAPIDLVSIALATWRLAYLITHEDGPFDLAVRFRRRFPLGGLTSCIYCVSVWAAALVYAALLIEHPAADFIVYTLAGSGGAMMLWRYTGGRHND